MAAAPQFVPVRPARTPAANVHGGLKISVGQWADKGRKSLQQDHHGACVPSPPALSVKGVALAVADGISSSEVSQEASRFAVDGFLADYYCTPDSWSVKTSGERVITAINSWLHAQTQRSRYRHAQDRGYVCTFSALVLKAHMAYVFHVGDTRVYRLCGNDLEQLTIDHRVDVGGGRSYLGRALGADQHVDIDFHALPLACGDAFLIATDGVHEHIDARDVTAAVLTHADDLDTAARLIVEEALRRGSGDNLTALIVRVDALPDAAPDPRADELAQRLGSLRMPPRLDARMSFEGYTILRELHTSHRSSIHLARDDATGETVTIKTPSTDLRSDAAGIERFMLEEWVARRIDSPHVLKPRPPERERRFIYIVNEFIDGRTLAQWMLDHPRPDVETVRGIIEQVAKGLRAFHRLEMLHQDLRPENVMVDAHGVVKIIDFGAVRVAGLEEMNAQERTDILGTLQYAAPEYFLGEAASPRSDQFSLGVIAYQMLSGRLPYGPQVPRLRTRVAAARLRYRSVLQADRDIPAWIDGVLMKAVHPEPARRYEALSEFVHDLRHPRREFLPGVHVPWARRNPVAFWRSISAALTVVALALAHALLRAH